MSGQLGSASAIEYFRNYADPSRPRGYLILAPFSGSRCPRGYEREFADTLSAVDRLQTTLLAQEKSEWEREQLHDETLIGERQRALVDKLRAKMVSGATTPYERDFIAAYLTLRGEKREKYRRIFEQRVAYLGVLAHETPHDRRSNEERVNLDRITINE